MYCSEFYALFSFFPLVYHYPSCMMYLYMSESENYRKIYEKYHQDTCYRVKVQSHRDTYKESSFPKRNSESISYLPY